MKPNLTIKIDGEKTQFGSAPSCVQRAMKVLDTQPDDAFLSTRGLASKIAISVERLHHFSGSSELAQYRVTVNGKTIWGNPKAIKKLSEQL